MKIFIVITNIFMGLVVLWLNINNLLFLSHPGTNYYHGISIAQGFTYAILGTILGIIIITTAVAFKKDKKWSLLVLATVPLLLGIWIVYQVYSVPVTEVAWAGGIMLFIALVLFTLFVIEILYLIFRKY
jgi:hypothetical protein